jgi:membrane dipeptidase
MNQLSPPIVDAHLDLAYNALRGRDVLRPAVEQAADEEGVPSVGLPDLHAGNVAMICGTIYCEPSLKEGAPGYRTADEARAAAVEQYEWYRRREQDGLMRLVRNPDDVPTKASPTPPLPTLLLMEGADPMRTPDDVPTWFDRGLRMIGLAWKRTRYAGGTGAPGPLTLEGVELVEALDEFGIIHDTSHLAEESFWQLLEISDGPVCASHSNCRAIVPTDRQLSDEMILAIVKRGGVIGINFYDKFLIPPAEYKTRRATLDDVILHIRHICDLAGSANHVAIGTDMDGGFGRDQIPHEIPTAAHLPKLAEAFHQSGFADDDVSAILGSNWLRFFRSNLPG